MLETTSEISPVFTAEQIAARIDEVARDIRKDAGTSEVFLLGILKGASLLLADLLRVIPGDVSYGFIEVVRDVIDNQTADAIEIDFLRFTDIRARKVYVLKDVVATGVIENYLLSQLRTHEPDSIKLVALLDRPDARTSDLTCDYPLFTIKDGVYAGYGLEQGRRYGNLPFIFRTA
ncbi:MAG TPA: phosphoribosyltransferase family protein [Thermoanaerobaculia bacterium]